MSKQLIVKLILGIVIVAVIAVLILFLFILPVESMEIGPVRLIDLQEFRQDCIDNLYRIQYFEGIKLEADKWVRLGRHAGAGDSIFWFYPLREFGTPFTEVGSPDKPFVLSGEGISIEYAESIEKAAAAEGPAWCFSQREYISVNRRWGHKDKFAVETTLPFETTRLELRAKTVSRIRFSIPSDFDPRAHLVVRLDGQKVGEVWVEKAGIKSYFLTIEANPGKHTLEFEFDNAIFNAKEGKDRFLVFKGVFKGYESKGITYKQPVGSPGPRAIGSPQLSFPGMDPLRSKSLKTITDLGEKLGTSFHGLSNPSFPFKLAADDKSSETRRSVFLISPAVVSATAAIPQGAVLDFAYGFMNESTRSEEGVLSLRLLEEGSKKVLFEKKIDLKGLKAGIWQKERVGLSDIGQKQAVVEFRYEGGSDQESALLLGEPVIRSRASTPDSKPNVILISIDTLRADHLSCYGYDRETSPALDKIAKEGILFTNAWSQSGYTLPSHKSFLTGYYPHLLFSNTGLADHHFAKLPQDVPIISTYLKNAGYYNVAFTGDGYVSAGFGFSRDFDVYGDQGTLEKLVDTPKGKRVVKENGCYRAFNWLKENRSDGPFFMFLHTYAVHESYAAPEEYDSYFSDGENSALSPYYSRDALQRIKQKLFQKKRGRDPDYEMDEEELEAIKSAYDRGIRWIDDEISRLYDLLKELGILDNTIIIITSDHGEEFLEHGQLGHSTLYNELLRVPLIIRWPKLPSGRRIETDVELVDILPTILDALDIRTQNRLHGSSLLPLIKNGGAPNEPRPIFSSKGNAHTLKHKRYKYHLISEEQQEIAEEIYDLSTDPMEQNNIINSDLMDKQIYGELIFRMLYYLAQNKPGLNVLVPDAAESVRVHAALLKIGDSGESGPQSEGGSHYFNNNISLTTNISKLKINNTPALVSYRKDMLEDNMILKLTYIYSDGGIVKFDKIQVGFPRRYIRGSPLIFSYRDALSSVSIRAGIPQSVFDEAGALILYTNYRWDKKSESQTELSEEAIRNLKALGYLQ